MRTIYLSNELNIVQNAKPIARHIRSATTGLALALLVIWPQISLILIVGLSFPSGALAQGAQGPQAISSASSTDNGDFPPQAPPVTRISRPHAAKVDGASGPAPGSEIKLMPLQPVTDPIGAPITTTGSPASSGSLPSPNGAPSSQASHPAPYQAGPTGPTSPSRPALLGPGGEDPYPTIGRLEGITLGVVQPTMPINDRLARLETTVFKRVYVADSLFDRTDRLKKTLLGPDLIDPNSAAARDRDELMPLGQPTGLGYVPGGLGPDLSPNLGPSMGLGSLLDNPQSGFEPQSAVHYLDELAARPENREQAPPNVLNQFALELINYERRNAGIAPLAADGIGESVAGIHVQELARRSVLSHFSLKGENPDRRYTLAGGNDAMVESIASVKCADLGNRKLTKAAVARLIKSLLSRQDDRDALMSPDASHLGFAIALSADKDKLLSAFEVISRHGLIESLPKEVAVGDKLEVKGAVESPYIFDRVTVAWEANNSGGSASSADESEEALPYFPPLDYVAYANHSDRDYSKAIFALKAVGVIAAIAGGMFIPPVALAAPLIMMSGGMGSEPKPVSDIPIKGGVKVEGASFNAKIPISNGNKEGLYYITVYGSLGSHAQQSVAISRRVVVAKLVAKGENEQETKPATKYDEEVSGQAEIKSGAGTAGGADLKPAPGTTSSIGSSTSPGNVSSNGSNIVPGSAPVVVSGNAPNKSSGSPPNKTDPPVIYSPESNQEGRADDPTKP